MSLNLSFPEFPDFKLDALTKKKLEDLEDEAYGRGFRDGWGEAVNIGIISGVTFQEQLTQAWDEGYSHAFDMDETDEEVRSLRDNPYRNSGDKE